VGDKKIVVIIKEENLAQAIGKDGQNIRLASKMLEKEIDVYGDEEFAAFTEEKRAEVISEGYTPSDAEGDQTADDVPDESPESAEAETPENVDTGESSGAPDEEILQSLVEKAVEDGTDVEKAVEDVTEAKNPEEEDILQ
jgi:N utilization substance protein A